MMIMKRMKIMMKMVTVHLVEELGDARKGESCNSAFDRLVGCLQLVQKADLMMIIRDGRKGSVKNQKSK